MAHGQNDEIDPFRTWVEPYYEWLLYRQMFTAVISSTVAIRGRRTLAGSMPSSRPRTIDPAAMVTRKTQFWPSTEKLSGETTRIVGRLTASERLRREKRIVISLRQQPRSFRRWTERDAYVAKVISTLPTQHVSAAAKTTHNAGSEVMRPSNVRTFGACLRAATASDHARACAGARLKGRNQSGLYPARQPPG
jgi:hypothetical protein